MAGDKVGAIVGADSVTEVGPRVGFVTSGRCVTTIIARFLSCRNLEVSCGRRIISPPFSLILISHSVFR